MKVVFCSTTGKVRAFTKKLIDLDNSIEVIEIENGKEVVSDRFLLITHTAKVGEMPSKVADFLNNNTNVSNAVGVIGSGNRNWGMSFCGGAYKASEITKSPVLHLFENRGSQKDVAKVLELIRALRQ